jgi:N-methylhydantoinase A
VGAAYVGAGAGHPNLIGIDIGGTSADISLIHDGAPGLTTNGRIGGWPVGLPMVDLVTIGAGGGSIARLTAGGTMVVGPESAGAQPGPVCYGRGGSEPTVTDAHLALGHLPPYLLGGGFALDVDAARSAIAKKFAEPLGLSIEAAARGILAIVDNNMVGAIRVVSVERGHDPRDFSLLPFGGAGPLHGGALARLLGIPTIVVPPAPGVLSALGLLVSSLKAEFTPHMPAEGRRLRRCRARPRVPRPRSGSARLARSGGGSGRGAAHCLVRQPALPAPRFRTHGPLGRPRGDRGRRRGNRCRLPPVA